ncbi:Phosphatidylinositol 4-kinase pik1alpha (PI4-kinase)(PtdIns-4-kinase) [Tulasnella sp. JGI-2019a]|nr:Phosphatidylinositol 4-kinase pik1alpha (PI4-kinase)(PtdIns-4-kinase) [Tulasnella sp. JGI-2019a]
MNHALLLRLFLSSSFFSVHVALQYLRLYSDNIGISHYLASRLREFSNAELIDVWGFICHLLITKPSGSIALETFVLERVELSTHVAMLTLFNCQALLHDLSTGSRTSPSFTICQRVLNRCYDVIFGDPAPTISTGPYRSPAVLGRPSSRFWRKKVKPRFEPALVGISAILAGAPGMPAMTIAVGKWAIDQGRIDDDAADARRMLSSTDDDAISPAPSTSSLVDSTAKAALDDSDDSDQGSPPSTALIHPTPSVSTGPSIIPPPANIERKIVPAQTTPYLPLHMQFSKPLSSRTTDPFGQFDHSLASSSTPSISNRSTLTRSTTGSLPILEKYDPLYQSQLLRSNYARSEVNFIRGLEAISNRLLVVPKPARVSALRAELTALNNSLPAEVCMPMWCSASDLPKSTAHHRIVRIPPGEAVVLNSAERAPYLLLIEILDGDLDFDPARRSNRDLLTKIVLQGEATAGKPGGGSLGRAPSFRRSIPKPQAVETYVQSPLADTVASPTSMTFGSEESDGIPMIGELIPPTPRIGSEDELDEMDLVEQIYGNDLKSQPGDLADSVVLPPQPKNKTLDSKTWSSSNPTSPNAASATSSAGHSPAPDHPKNARFPSISQDLTLDDYSERMRAAASMLAQLNTSLVKEPVTAVGPPGTVPAPPSRGSGALRWLPGKGWILAAVAHARPSQDDATTQPSTPATTPIATRMKLQPSEVASITERIMQEMLALEEERMQRMKERVEGESGLLVRETPGGKTQEDENIVRRELNKEDPSAIVFRESWTAKKARIRSISPYGHLANWDCVSVIVKTGGDLRQEQLAVQLIHTFEEIWKAENCLCWVRYFRILITGSNSGLVETITDSVSIHSIKKAEYARRLAEGNFRQVTLFDHFASAFGDPTSAKFRRAQRNFAKSLAGYSIITYILQIKDRHNGNILLDRDGHMVHIDFGFMLSNSPGNMGFEAAPFKLPMEYIEVLGGLEGEHFVEFKRLFREGFEAARKHSDSLITLVELMQKDSSMPCFSAFGEHTANMMRERFQPNLTHAAVGDFVDKLIMTSLASAWTRLYDSFQYFSQGVL